jgi:hypothetical protein
MALQRANGEVHRLIAKQAPIYIAEIRERQEEALVRALGAITSLKNAYAELYGMKSLREWFERPTRSFGPAQGQSQLSTWHGDVPSRDVYEALEKAATEIVSPQHPVRTSQAPPRSPDRKRRAVSLNDAIRGRAAS